ncbi:hypothetical protein HanRHA438_Chr05g0216701 [Helianthus annuus]|nr:hypothetical protein HanRHA438_Chr05g0216701 [Helianthus annuus]
MTISFIRTHEIRSKHPAICKTITVPPFTSMQSKTTYLLLPFLNRDPEQTRNIRDSNPSPNRARTRSKSVAESASSQLYHHRRRRKRRHCGHERRLRSSPVLSLLSLSLYLYCAGVCVWEQDKGRWGLVRA